jgi:hypothetical protein
MSGKVIQNGNLAGEVSANGTLQATVGSQGTLGATIAPAATLQANIAASRTLQGTVVPEKTLAGTASIPKKVVVGTGSNPKIGEVTLLASDWVSYGNLHSQVVDIEGVTKNSQVDLTPSVEQLLIFYEKDLTFTTENDNGTVTVYAIGQKPTNDYTIQVTITEVEV